MFFRKHETNLEFTYKVMVGYFDPNKTIDDFNESEKDLVRYQATLPLKAHSLDGESGFKKQLSTMFQYLCFDLSNFYNGQKQDLSNSANQSQIDNSYSCNMFKFLVLVKGKLDDENVDIKFTTITELIDFAKEYDIHPTSEAVKILKYSEQKNGIIFFHPENEPHYSWCTVL